MNKKWIAIPSLLLLGLVGTVAALPLVIPVLLPMWDKHRPLPKVAVDRSMRTQAIDTLVAELNQHYVFPDKAKQMETLLRKRQREGVYDTMSDGEQFAARLTADLASVAHDVHMEVEFDPEPIAAASPGADASPNLLMRLIDGIGRLTAKMGVDKVGHLSPGIGYLRMAGFSHPRFSAGKYADTMDKLADTDALIIDLRGSRGGRREAVALLVSYFVDQRTRLNDIWSRDTGETTQSWTQDQLAGKRYGGKKPVLILVDRGTRSAAEDFAYTMQAIKRATVIGERTWGGAHPTGAYRLGEHFMAAIPNSRSISPITHTNWEGVGVIPDVPAAPANALAVAKDMLQRRSGGAGTLASAN